MKERPAIRHRTAKKHDEQKLFRQYRRSYMGMLLVAAGIISALMIFLLRSSIREKEIRLRQDAVMHFAADLENQMGIFNEIYDKILTSSYYQPNRIFLNPYYEIPAAEDLARYAGFSPVIDYMFLYYKGEELCFTSNGSKSSFGVLFDKKLGIKEAAERDRLATLINTIGVSTLVRITDYQGQEKLLFLYPIKFHGAESARCEAILGYTVSEQALHSRMQSVYGYQFDQFTVYIDGKRCFGEFTPEEVHTEKLPAPGSSRQIPLEHDQILLAANSEKGLVQVYVTGNWDPFLNEMIQNIGFILLAVGLIASIFFFFAMFLARRHAQPIARLAETYGVSADSSSNELGEIENALKIHMKNSNIIARNAKEQLLLLILQGKSDSYMLRRWEKYGISFPYPNNMVYVISILKKSSEKQENLITEIESFANPDAHIYAIMLQEKARVVVLGSFNYRSEQENMYENLLALTSGDESTGKVYMGISCDLPEKLSVSYQEALTTLHSDNEAFRNSAPIYTRITELLLQVRRGVEEQSLDAVQYYLKQIEEIFAQEETYAPMQRYVCNNLLSSLSLLYYENQMEFDRQRFSDLMVEQDFSVFCSHYGEMLEIVLSRQNTKEETTPEKILTFMEEHLSDCDLCLDELSYSFNLNVDYISRLIKGKTGIGFKEYLTGLRIEKAKKLLVEHKELSVAEIGVHVGYRTPSNFIKKFRDEMGMTPLQFRSNHLK